MIFNLEMRHSMHPKIDSKVQPNFLPLTRKFSYREESSALSVSSFRLQWSKIASMVIKPLILVELSCELISFSDVIVTVFDFAFVRLVNPDLIFLVTIVDLFIYYWGKEFVMALSLFGITNWFCYLVLPLSPKNKSKSGILQKPAYHSGKFKITTSLNEKP